MLVWSAETEADLRFRTRKAKAVWQVSAQRLPELLRLLFSDEIELIVVAFEFDVASNYIGSVRSVVASRISSSPASKSTLASCSLNQLVLVHTSAEVRLPFSLLVSPS